MKRTHIKKRKKSYLIKTIADRPETPKMITEEEFEVMQRLLLTLQTLSQKLVSEIDVASILSEIMKTLGESLGAVWVNIWELTPDGKATYIKQGYGRPGTETYITHSRAHPLKLGTAFIGRVLETKKTWSSSDVWKDPHLPRSWVARVKEQNFRAIVCTPQIVESAKVIGGMCVYFDHPRILSDFEMRLITIASNQAAVAIVNAHIYGELAAERDKNLAIVNSLHEGIILYDNEGKVIIINPKAQELLLVQGNDIVGRSITEEMAGRNVVFRNLYRVGKLPLGDFESKEYETEGPKKAVLVITSVPVHGTGELKKIGAMRILRDITEEKELDLLESKFISTASHQLRTPLAGLRWALEGLKGEDEGSLTASQRDLVDKSYTTATNLNTLLDDLLRVSKVEEGGLVYDFKTQDFTAALESILEEYGIPLKERGLTLVFKKPETPLPPVTFDKETLSIALRNVIDNAIRYSFPKGTLAVTIAVGTKSVIVSVKDKGIGIPEEDKKFIFSRFFRAKNAQLYQTEGSGLGLYLAKSIIERHHGRIFFESKENEGAEFFIHIPLESTIGT